MLQDLAIEFAADEDGSLGSREIADLWIAKFDARAREAAELISERSAYDDLSVLLDSLANYWAYSVAGSSYDYKDEAIDILRIAVEVAGTASRGVEYSAGLQERMAHRRALHSQMR